MATRNGFPTHASVVVIGGGVMGLSSAYQLASSGVKDVVLIEKGSLGEGSSSRAAGGLRAQFSDEANIRLALRSMETYRTFAADFDQEIDLHEVGYLFLLDNEADVATFTANVELQNSLGVPSRMISADEAQQLSPLIETDDLLAAAFSPTDAHCTPESVVLGLARAARKAGVADRHRMRRDRHRARRGRRRRRDNREGSHRDKIGRLCRRCMVEVSG